jgi:hypothetical protein
VFKKAVVKNEYARKKCEELRGTDWYKVDKRVEEGGREGGGRRDECIGRKANNMGIKESG